ncbi:hypothetical protein [Pseudonocardia pini]|uniref:hypothetical protein n=1 Tax=Pseudonocardia pini TaxID=2758030 RepID=UPI001C68D846|nr:hypothetical protein [Pseudonocardia pini]
MLNRAWWATAAGTVLTLFVLGGYTSGASLPAALDPALLPATADSDLGAVLRARLSGLVVAAVAGTLLVEAEPTDRTGRSVRGAAVLAGAAALAVTWAGPNPVTVAVLLAAGLVVGALLARRARWPRRVSAAAVVGGVALLGSSAPFVPALP